MATLTIDDKKRSVMGAFLGYTEAQIVAKSLSDLEKEFWEDPDLTSLLNNGPYVPSIDATRIILSTESDILAVNTVGEVVVASLATPTSLAAGDRLVFRVGGDLLNNTAGAVTYRPRLKLGSTTVMVSGLNSLAQSTSRRSWYGEFVFALATPSSQRAVGFIAFSAASVLELPMSSSTLFGVGDGVATEDLVTSKNIQFTIEMGTADANVDFICKQASLTLLRKLI